MDHRISLFRMTKAAGINTRRDAAIIIKKFLVLPVNPYPPNRAGSDQVASCGLPYHFGGIMHQVHRLSGQAPARPLHPPPGPRCRHRHHHGKYRSNHSAHNQSAHESIIHINTPLIAFGY